MSDYKNTVDPTKPVVVSGPSPSARNAVKHGCCALDTLLLPTESADDFNALVATYCKAYNPSSEAERHLVQELANADWLLQRTTKAYVQVEAALYQAHPNPSDWTEQQERKLGRHLRYRTAQNNLVLKCRKAVEDYRKARANERMAAEKLNLAQERLKATQKKNAPEPTWKEHLENMRQQAMSMGFTPPTDPSKR